MGATILTLPPSTALSYQPVQLTEPRLGSHLQILQFNKIGPLSHGVMVGRSSHGSASPIASPICRTLPVAQNFVLLDIASSASLQERANVGDISRGHSCPYPIPCSPRCVRPGCGGALLGRPAGACDCVTLACQAASRPTLVARSVLAHCDARDPNKCVDGEEDRFPALPRRWNGTKKAAIILTLP
jgi:hypothetical protein